MEIPAIYSVFKGGEVMSAPVRFDGARISFESEPERLAYSADEEGDRGQVLVVDVRGLGRRWMDERLLTNARFPGSDVWFLTHVRDVGDVFDCFIGGAARLLLPYHTARRGRVMREAYELSENCVPVVFVSRGRALCGGGRTADVGAAVEELAGIGYREVAALDTDSSLGEGDWAHLRDRLPGLIPFVRSRGSVAAGGFKDVIADF